MHVEFNFKEKDMPAAFKKLRNSLVAMRQVWFFDWFCTCRPRKKSGNSKTRRDNRGGFHPLYCHVGLLSVLITTDLEIYWELSCSWKTSSCGATVSITMHTFKWRSGPLHLIAGMELRARKNRSISRSKPWAHIYAGVFLSMARGGCPSFSTALARFKEMQTIMESSDEEDLCILMHDSMSTMTTPGNCETCG